MRPNRSIVVRHRIVTSFAGRDCAHTPSRIKVFRFQFRNNRAAMIPWTEPGEQDLARVGAPDLAALLLSIQCNRIRRNPIGPERLVKPVLQNSRFPPKRGRPFPFTQRFKNIGNSTFRGVNVALHLAERYWSLSESSIAVKY